MQQIENAELGEVAAAIAIFTALLITFRWIYYTLKRGRLRAKLRKAVHELRSLDRRLRTSVTVMEREFSVGFLWTGYAIFGGKLGDCLDELQDVVTDASDLVATLRALEASGADERLRRDVETIADGIRRVAPLYIWGIVKSYRSPVAHHPAKHGPATVQLQLTGPGREATRTLRSEDRVTVREVKLSLRVLFRTVIHRLNMPELSEEGFAHWPTYVIESYLDADDLEHLPLISPEDA